MKRTLKHWLLSALALALAAPAFGFAPDAVIDDIRALGGNSDEDNRRFAAVARLSDVNLGLYRALAQPAVRALATEQSAEALRQINPNRLRFAAFSDRNPAMAPVKAPRS